VSTEIFFDTIKDAAWHRLNKLADQLKVPVEKLMELSLFLSSQGIIQYQEETQRIRIKPEWKILFPDEKFKTTPN
jgi:hypothetical protein